MSGATPLGYQVVFWDSEAPGFEGNRIQFSEKHVLPVDTTKASSGAWRSDRRCQFPLEIGLRLQAPCRLQEVVLVSEPALAPSAVECFVAGPTRSKSEALRRGQGKRSLATSAGGMDRRHNGSTTASTDAARAGYLSSVFVWAGRAEFSCAKTEIVAANGTDSSRTEGLRQDSETVPNDATMTAGAPSVAVLSGLTFKGQFLRLVLWEAAGSSDNPGRQVSVARIQVSGYLLSEEGQLGNPKPSAQNRKGAAGGTPSFLGEDGDHDRELEQVLLDLGIEPLLAQGPSGNKRARDWGGLGRRGVARGSSGSDAVHALDGKGWGGAERAVEEAEDGSAAEAMKKVKQMLHIARSEERFHEAEMLSLQLDRVRSLASTLCSARRAQERAARRENFDQAKRFRDDAREAEVWLRQTIRDASDIYAGGDGRSSRQEAEPPLAADTAPVAGTDVQSASSPTPGTDLQELAPSHDAGSNHSTEQTPGEGNPNDLAGKVVGRRPSSGDGSERGAHDKDRPPWLSPACPRSAQPWRVLLKLPWPAGVQPDFRTVFSHKWGSSTVKAYRNHSAATELGGGSTSRSALQPGGLLRTILRLVAASQDLRPPGPVPPDTVPFRQAGSVYGRPPLCTFFLSPENLADGGGGGDGEAAKAGKNRVPGNKSNDEVVGQVKEVGRKRRAGAREGGVAISGGGQTFTDEENGGAEGAADLQVGDLGRAFGHPAADSSPAATHVVNFIEDNPGLAWSSSALRGPRRRSVHYLRHARGDDHESRHDEATSASGAEAGRKTAKGKRRRSKADEDGDEKSAVEGARIRSKKRSEGDRQGGTETVVAVGSEVVSRERLREEATASSTSAAAVLPDVVGAGGFAEFIPLLDTIFGRVPMSAACAGFPARMRESSIRLCQAHLGLTADAAVEACIAATDSSLVSTTATATNSITSQPTSSSSNGRPPASGTATQRGSETGKRRGSQAALSGELKAEELKSHRTNASNDSRESESRSSSKRSCSSSSSSSAIGAVVRAACLVAAQGLMDPKKEVRLAGADLARAALSLCSSVPVAVEEGVGDKEEAETAVVDAAAARRSSATAKKGSTSNEDHGIVGDDHACGNAAVQGRGSVGSDDGASGYTMSSSEAASDSEDKERPQTRAAQSDSARIGSKQEPQGSSPRISVGGSAASPASADVRAAVPLRDLRWGLELILACVAPYLTNRDVVSPEKRGERVMPTTAGSAAGSVGDTSGRCSTSAFTDSGRNAVSAPSEDIAGNALDETSAEEGEDSGDGCIRNDKEEREELAQSAGDSPLAKEDEPGEDCQDDADRSLLALRVVDFACRHPDIGPALVSSVLVGWIPCLAQWGRNTPSFASPDRNHTKIGRASMPRSPRCAAFTVGEAAASEALAAGAIEMIVFMVNNFPLLPLSDFSTETLVAAAEGGMAFAGRTRSTSAGDGNGRQRDGVGGRRRDGEATGGSGVAAAAARGRAGEDVRRGSINGRAKKAGEALMLELFLRTSGGGHGGLDLGIDGCLESLLPALNTARGINFLDKTATTADLRASETRRADELEKALKTGVLERGGQGKGGLEEGNKSHGTRSGNRASTRAVRKRGERAIKWPSRRCPFASKVEVRQRLALPPTPPTTNPLADRSLSSSTVSNDRSGAAENGKQNASTSSEHGEVCHLARHDTTPGVYQHMSDSSSAEALSASTAKSAVSLVSAGGGGAATAPGGVHGDDDSSSFASFSHGSLSSTSLEDGSGADGGSNTDSTAATGRKPGEVTAETKKQQAAAAHDDRSVKQAAVAEINRSSTKVFPILSFGGKKSNDVEDPGRNYLDEQTSVGNAKTVTAEEKPAGKPTGAAKPKKGVGGFVSKLFGRGKK